MVESAAARVNPFEFGGELEPSSLIDREEELDLVLHTLEQGGKLFLIGPRRYGKTSILAAVEHRLAGSDVVVLRHDAEVYESLGALAEALLASAAKRLTGNLDEAVAAVKRFASKLSPGVTYDLVEQSLSIRFALSQRAAAGSLPVLTDVLNAVDRLARENGRRVAVILDEFQQVVQAGGAAAERQIRGTIQRHHNTAYVFAGSKTRLLADMTNDPGRAFWKLGARLFLGPVPRPAWVEFLLRGFSRAGFRASDVAVSHLIDLAEDVPYNIQQLANLCWELLRASGGGALTARRADEALTRLVARENAAYTQIWNSLTQAQKIAVKAVILEKGTNLRAAPVLARYALAASTMHRALKILDDRGIVREDESVGSIRYRLEDPFLAHWLRMVQA